MDITHTARRHEEAPRSNKTLTRLSLGLALACAAYCGSYWVMSRAEMYEGITTGAGPVIWAFSPCRQRMDQFLINSDVARAELTWYIFYSPLIYLDRLFGNVHIFSPDVPDVGG